jgi:hypothetical protein
MDKIKNELSLYFTDTKDDMNSQSAVKYGQMMLNIDKILSKFKDNSPRNINCDITHISTIDSIIEKQLELLKANDGYICEFQQEHQEYGYSKEEYKSFIFNREGWEMSDFFSEYDKISAYCYDEILLFNFENDVGDICEGRSLSLQQNLNVYAHLKSSEILDENNNLYPDCILYPDSDDDE